MSSCVALLLELFIDRPITFMSCAEGHELMVKRQVRLDAVCVLLLALFLVGLAGYSVVVRFLK